MGRLTREDSELYLFDQPSAPAAVESAPAQITVLGTLAARSTTDILALPQDETTIDVTAWGPLALYGIRSPCLGSIALSGQVVITSLEREARDGDPVIALCGDKVYARRIASDQRDPSRITLIADRSGTERVPPTRMLPRSKTRLLPIVGILYEQVSVPGQEEACLVDRSPIWERWLSAARIVDDSAYPIIRDDDLVLLERIEDVTTDALQRLEDRIVAVVASSGSESFGFLKRMGSALQPGVRNLEKIGLTGSSVRVRVSVDEEGQDSGILMLDRLWRVHGVIRSEILPR